METSMLNNSVYTVGWVSAIPIELQAATLFFTAKHGRPQSKRKDDDNRYVLGEIAGHKVVVASLPAPDTVALLIKLGADIRARDRWGRTAIMVAVLATNGQSAARPLLGLQAQHRLETLRLVLQAADESDIEARDSTHGLTPLILAVYSCWQDVVELLLAHGSNVEAMDKTGKSALFIAVEIEKVDIVRLLLEKGANTETRDPVSSLTPLLLLAGMRNLTDQQAKELSTLLLERDANKEAKDGMGQIALLRAAHVGQCELVTSLLRLIGCQRWRVDEPADNGRTALFLATVAGHC
ncbi:ankyrin repeat-containing domain protein [Podospora fimiseda]|uniref:Ankyrin repeat-containing domain protein n=1 Tax=Podospora fimiseda TaxID=252190 RepID=A0AAN7BFZ4_9PEZI|nr:ankyrin repeat-containing domain protein [Podospora fimiseda]